MPYTLAQAAAATGLNKTSVLRAIKSGKISGTKDEFGQWYVEPVELHRVYPPAASAAVSTDAAPHDAIADVAELAVLRKTVAAAEASLAALKEQLHEMRTDRDTWREQANEWREQAKGLRLALPAPGRRWWWQRQP